jgi:hypothetical protein
MRAIRRGLGLGLLLALGLLAGPAWADSVVMSWDPAAGATSYDVLRATDFGPTNTTGTWTVIGTVQATACTGTPVLCTFSDNAAPATGVVSYRITPKNATGPLPLTKKGLYYCGVCAEIPSKPGSLGVGL